MPDRSVTAISITERGSGSSLRLHLEWTDPAGARQTTMLSGYSMVHVRAELWRQDVIGPAARQAFLTGLALGFQLGEPAHG